MGSSSPELGGGGGGKRPQYFEVLYNVSMQNSPWPVKVMMSPENTARELMKVAIELYVARKHRPLLESTDPASYQLHYSQFNFESLELDQKLKFLKSRNFYVCKNFGSD